MKALLVLALLARVAIADDDRGVPPGGSAAEGRRGEIDRPIHGSASVGGSLLATGAADAGVLRGDVEVDVEPYSRYGGLLALRAFDKDHRGLLCAGLYYEGAAARPRLVLALHADVGADLDVHAPLAGGGIRTTLILVGPLAVALDSGAYLVIHGVDHSRLVLTTAAMLALAW